jgi:hypothetical protein
MVRNGGWIYWGNAQTTRLTPLTTADTLSMKNRGKQAIQIWA